MWIPISKIRHNVWKAAQCRDSNSGPLDLESSALPPGPRVKYNDQRGNLIVRSSVQKSSDSEHIPLPFALILFFGVIELKWCTLWGEEKRVCKVVCCSSKKRCLQCSKILLQMFLPFYGNVLFPLLLLLSLSKLDGCYLHIRTTITFSYELHENYSNKYD